MATSDRMPVNPDLLAGIAKGDSSVLATMASWMYARDPISPPAWTIADAAAVLERTRPGIAYADLTACNDYPGAAAVAAVIRAPVLLLLGEQDVMTKPTAAEPISDAATDATTVIVEGAGHLMMVERPDVTNDALLTFLRGTAG
jgi:pimeloyl-ACP methyl ester carboxylesterase